MLKPWSVVERDAERWLVREIVGAVGGAKVAQLECLDRDASAAVDVVLLDAEVQMTDEEIAKARAVRDANEAPRRLRLKIGLHGKQIAKAKAALAELEGARDEAKAKLAVGDLRPIENRQIVPGKVLRLEPEAIVRMADDAIRGIRLRIDQAEKDLAADRKALAGEGGPS